MNSVTCQICCRVGGAASPFPVFQIVLTAITLLFATSPAQAQRVCDGYPEQFTATELKSLSARLRAPMPAKYARALDNIPIENAPDGSADSILPEARFAPDKRSARIVIPRGFRKLNCQLAQVADDIYRQNSKGSESFGRDISECFARTRDRHGCLRSSLERRSREIDSRPAESTTYAASLRAGADAALRFVLAHEAVHVLIDRGAYTLDPNIDIESTADLIASFALASRDNIFGATLALNILSALDETYDWAGEVHPPYACRADAMALVYARLTARIIPIENWRTNHKLFLDTQSYIPTASYALPVYGKRLDCPYDYKARLNPIATDLDTMIAFLKATGSADNAAALRTIDGLTDLPLKTELARSYRSGFMAKWGFARLSEAEKSQQSLDGEDLTSLHLYSKRLGDIGRLTQRLRTELAARLVAASDYGWMMTSLLMIQAQLGSGISATTLDQRIADLKQYDPESSQISYYKGLQEVLRGRCPAAEALFDQADAIAADTVPRMVRELMDVDEDEDERPVSDRCRGLRKMLAVSRR